MLWGELTTDREDGYPRKYYELTIGKSLTFYVSFYGFLGTIHNARQKRSEKKREEKRKEETLERRKEKIIEIIVCDNAALVSSVFDKKIPLDNAR
tara:strand:+ start:270 stop:554 length:285 start_codon:yes stop_codon:yes gene_type:complete